MMKPNTQRSTKIAARCAAALLFLSTGAAAQSVQSEVNNLNPGNRHITVTPGPGEVKLRWEDVKGPINSWNLYYREGRIADNSAAEMCAQRPNVLWYHPRRFRNAHIRDLKELTYYTFLIEAEYRDQPKPSVDPKCDYVAHLEIQTDAEPRELRKVGDLQLYGNDGSIFVRGGKWMRTPYLDVYHAVGYRDAAYMCKHQPNWRGWRRLDVGENRWIDNLDNRQLHTIMVVLRQEKKKCHYAIRTVRPLQHAKRGDAFERINPGYLNIGKHPGDGAVMLKWERTQGKLQVPFLRDRHIEAYYIYYQKNTPGVIGMTPAELCSQRPNRVRIDRNTHHRITEKLITGLENGQQYTFLLEAKFRNPPAPRYCGYLYHGNLVPNKVQVTEVRKSPPGGTAATPRNNEVLLKWRDQRKYALAWHIYTIEGVVKDLKKICTERPNPIKILSGSISQYRMLHLENDTPYTFLVEGYYKKDALPPEVSSLCKVTYHTHATPVPD